MELKEKITLDMLTKDSVSVQKCTGNYYLA